MLAALSYNQSVAFCFVNYAVYFVNPATPISLQVSAQRLWFAYTDKWVAVNIFNKHINALQSFPILRLPV